LFCVVGRESGHLRAVFWYSPGGEFCIGVFQ
jgi:hypothetical protein